MSADIAIQDATHVPVGEDQLAHIELTRRIVRRFNNRYGAGETILTEPKTLAQEALRIAALVSKDGKMSKSKPQSDILLRDSPEIVAKKIKKAETALPGEMNETLDSHFTVARLLADDERSRQNVDTVLAEHLEGKPVMGSFKTLLTDYINTFLANFNERFDSVSDDEIRSILKDGGDKANQQANKVDSRVREALGLTGF
jgi:tryptophanyl-tRNA synthetase